MSYYHNNIKKNITNYWTYNNNLTIIMNINKCYINIYMIIILILNVNVIINTKLMKIMKNMFIIHVINVLNMMIY